MVTIRRFIMYVLARILMMAFLLLVVVAVLAVLNVIGEVDDYCLAHPIRGPIEVLFWDLPKKFVAAFGEIFFSAQTKAWVGGACFSVFVMPFLWRTITYYVLTRYVEMKAGGNALPYNAPQIGCGASERTVRFVLRGKERLYLRSMLGDCVTGRTHLNVRTKMMWSLRHLFVSMASDMTELRAYSVEKGQESGEVVIASPAADAFLMNIEIPQKGGIIVRPRNIVGVTNGISITTRWSFRLHNIIEGRIREIVLRGPGHVLILGEGGFNVYTGTTSTKVERNVVLARSVESAVALCRNECFYPYLKGMSSLFDMQLLHGTLVAQARVSDALATQNRNPLEIFFDMLGSTLGGMFGF